MLVDLSGPIRADDGILQRRCLEAGVGYVDIAVHDSHFETANAISAELGGFTLVHTGLFPGLSNLIAAEFQTPEQCFNLAEVMPEHEHEAFTLTRSQR